MLLIPHGVTLERCQAILHAMLFKVKSAVRAAELRLCVTPSAQPPLQAAPVEECELVELMLCYGLNQRPSRLTQSNDCSV